MKMRVAIAYNFNDEDWIGGRNYFASLFHSLRAIDDGSIQLVFVTGTHTKTMLPDEFPFLEVHRTPLMDRKHPLWVLRQLGLRTLDTDPLLANYLRKLSIDVLTHSGYLGRNPGVRTLPWLFDFQFMHLPAHWSPSQLRWVSRRYASSCEQGDGVIVSSQDALNDLRKFLPEARVPMHVLRFVSNPVDLANLTSLELLQKRHGLLPQYFHLPNQFWTHKNHRVVIDALGILKARGIHAQIVCTGSKSDPRSPDYFGNLISNSHKLGVADSFNVCGVLPYAETQALMAHATAVINPSFFEGWSTTVEEAKTLGKRLLLSDIPVHREQSPDQGHFFQPDDAGLLASLMQHCMEVPQAIASAAQITASYRKRADDFAREFVRILQDTMRSDG